MLGTGRSEGHSDMVPALEGCAESLQPSCSYFTDNVLLDPRYPQALQSRDPGTDLRVGISQSRTCHP